MPDLLPPKPRYGAPCNGCGACCSVSHCEAARIALGHDAPLPCPLLRYRDGRTWCGLVLAERRLDEFIHVAGMHRTIESALGIGEGCGMEDEDD